MPWKETNVVDQRTEFALRVLRGGEDFSTVCRDFNISRATGYKWKARFFEQGYQGLKDQSRRPHTSPGSLSEDMVCRIVKLKHAHPSWGARKLREVLQRTVPASELPSESSFKRVLDKANLVQRRRRKPQSSCGRLRTPAQAERPNHVWTIDFKGYWYTRDRSRFEPLTIRDDYSRYVLCAQALENARTETVREQMSRIFQRFGLPQVIRSDNGAPFACYHSPLGLSRLSAWWLTLGIDLDRIAPARPDQNGGHERMHRDVAIEVEANPEEDPVSQQATLDVWRKTFNEERPHEALGMQVPSAVYQKSPRCYEDEPNELAYPGEYLVRKVSRRGQVRIHDRYVHVSAALAGWHVGLESLRPPRLAVWFSRLCLGTVDLQASKFYRADRAGRN